MFSCVDEQIQRHAGNIFYTKRSYLDPIFKRYQIMGQQSQSDAHYQYSSSRLSHQSEATLLDSSVSGKQS